MNTNTQTEITTGHYEISTNLPIIGGWERVSERELRLLLALFGRNLDESCRGLKQGDILRTGVTRYRYIED